jgi:tryptophan synthase alpha chain
MKTNRLTEAIQKTNEQGNLALIPFLPAGFPDKDLFWEHIANLDKAGADIIEIGVPFSDPIADGPIIEQASAHCLQQGINIEWIFDHLWNKRSVRTSEIVLMGYTNPFLQYGWHQLARDAVACNVSGIIVPDLPYEESREINDLFTDHGLDLIPLVGLNTPVHRLHMYAEIDCGFVYVVSVLGTTGSHTSFSYKLKSTLSRAREIFHQPLALGFGVNHPDQVSELRHDLNAVVFGSSLIDHLSHGKTPEEFLSVWKS